MLEKGGFDRHQDPEKEKVNPQHPEKLKKDSFNPYASTAKLNKKDHTSESEDSATDTARSTTELVWEKQLLEAARKYLPANTRKLEELTSEADAIDRPRETKTSLPEKKPIIDRRYESRYRVFEDHSKHLQSIIDAH